MPQRHRRTCGRLWPVTLALTANSTSAPCIGLAARVSRGQWGASLHECMTFLHALAHFHDRTIYNSDILRVAPPYALGSVKIMLQTYGSSSWVSYCPLNFEVLLKKININYHSH